MGERSWQEVGSCIGNRLGQQCLHRWQKAVDPTIKKGRWTPKEDQELRSAILLFGTNNWINISKHVFRKTDVQCRERWMNVLHPNLNSDPWVKEEDDLLIRLVNKIGLSKWSEVSSLMPNRTDNQCWRRWKYHIRNKF